MDITKSKKSTPLQVIVSVLAALFGVQSDNNRQHDFKQSSPWPFIVVGIVIIGAMIMAIIAVAQWATAI